ncbi:hypothetical protein ACO0LC_18650 [Undibacterium sp. JH2W]|uniref:hypothetical protein n=1 Tax=Undibacterium sp. JH2W TaxID=3413037 RepID=UPI003BF38DFE
MKHTFLFTLMILAVCSCSEPIPNRAESPEAAFLAARAALKNHDLKTYFDALTDQAVLDELGNSVMICLSGSNPKAVAAGLKQSIGCEEILKRYNWPASAGNFPDAYKAAIAKIHDSRSLAAELEANHRRYDAGTSFVWDYLDKVRLSNLVVEGTKAHASAEWESGDKGDVRFEKDATGWRFDPMPGAR